MALSRFRPNVKDARTVPSGVQPGRLLGDVKVRFSIDASRCIECGACGRICTFGAVITSTGDNSNPDAPV